MLAQLTDPNLSGSIEFEFETKRELDAILERRGTWQQAPDGGGSILLSDPEVWVAYERSQYGYDLYPDFVVRIVDDRIDWDKA